MNLLAENIKNIQSGDRPVRRRFKALLIAVPAVIVTGVILAAVWGVYLYDKIYPGISCAGINLSGMTQEKAAETLKQLSSPSEEYPAGTMTVELAEIKLEFNREKIGAHYIVDDVAGTTASALYKIGREGSFFTRLSHILSGIGGTKDYEPERKLVFDEEVIKNAVADAVRTLNMEAVPFTTSISENGITITRGEPGRMFNADAISAMIIQKIKDEDLSGVGVDPTVLPVENIDLQALYDSTYRDPVDSVLISGEEGYYISEDIPGVMFDMNAAASNYSDPSWNSMFIPFLPIPAATTSDLLAQELFRDVLSEYYTILPSSTSENRRTNIVVASGYINETILLPGEVFSYNKVVGIRTAERGFKLAGAYLGGASVNEIGGGICQTSSTLYMGVLLANLKIVDRTNHSLTVSYIPLGLDATVGWNSIDFKFENDTPYPIRVLMWVEGKNVYVKIEGTKISGNYVVMENKVLSITSYETVYRENPSLAPGATKVVQDPHNGHSVESYRVIMDENGNEISRTLEAKSRYRKADKIIEQGPAKVTPSPSPSPEPSPSPSPSPLPEPSPSPSPEPSPSQEPPPSPSPEG